MTSYLIISWDMTSASYLIVSGALSPRRGVIWSGKEEESNSDPSRLWVVMTMTMTYYRLFLDNLDHDLFSYIVFSGAMTLTSYLVISWAKTNDSASASYLVVSGAPKSWEWSDLYAARGRVQLRAESAEVLLQEVAEDNVGVPLQRPLNNYIFLFFFAYKNCKIFKS